MPLGVVALLISSVLKGTALLVVAFMIARLLSKAPASARHLVWSVALVGVLVIPALSRTIPWKLEVLPAIKGVPVAGAAHADQAQIPLTASLETDRTTGTTATWSPQLPTARQFLSWARLIWLFGMVVLSVRIAISFGAVRWMAWRGGSTDLADWDDELGRARRVLGLTGPTRLIVSRLASIPFTTGVWRPVIVLPPSSSTWNRGLRRAVLLHELSHIRRWDVLTHFVSQAACALYWFHPLVWVAAKRLRVECERACDDLVLNSGERPADYAGHLLAIVRDAVRRRTPALAMPMARRAGLEERLSAILESDGRLRSLSRRSAGMIVASMILAVIPLSALAPNTALAPDTVLVSNTVLAPDTALDRRIGAPDADPVVDMPAMVLSGRIEVAAAAPVLPAPLEEEVASKLTDRVGGGEAQRGLEQDRVGQLGIDIEEAQARAADLVREQRDIEAEMDRLGEAGGGRSSEAGRRLYERKEAMGKEIADLERDIDRLASDIRADQEEASDRLREAVTTIRDDKLKERVRYSRGLIGIQDREYMTEFEAETTRIVEELQEELQSVVVRPRQPDGG